MILIVIIVILIVIILNLMKLILMKSENFEDTTLDDLANTISQLEKRNRNKNVLDSVDKSVLVGENKLSGLVNNRFNKVLLDEYVNNLISSDYNSTDKILEHKPYSKMPTVSDDNLSQYNHEMRIINNSKKLKQEYIIKILKLKVMKLLNSTKRVNSF